MGTDIEDLLIEAFENGARAMKNAIEIKALSPNQFGMVTAEEIRKVPIPEYEED